MVRLKQKFLKKFCNSRLRWPWLSLPIDEKRIRQRIWVGDTASFESSVGDGDSDDKVWRSTELICYFCC